jgi:hypothetical protein
MFARLTPRFQQQIQQSELLFFQPFVLFNVQQDFSTSLLLTHRASACLTSLIRHIAISNSALAHSLEKASARSLISFQASAIEFLGLFGG